MLCSIHTEPLRRARRNENRVATSKARNARSLAAPAIAPLQTEPKRGALTSAGSSRSLPAYSFVNWAKAVVTGCSLLACQGSLVISASKERTGRMASNKRSRTTEARLRSEEHTSELQSLMRISYPIFCLKKKNKTQHKQ